MACRVCGGTGTGSESRYCACPIGTTLRHAAQRTAEKGSQDAIAAYGYQMMYLGAFAALNIKNGVMLFALVDLTRSDAEAAEVVARLRDAKEGDRVWPALAYLRALRAGAQA
jgi:hypothetical protein